MEGGSGRASVTSPTTITVDDDSIFAEIEWSSPYYDYMIVNNETYLPVNGEGNSVFEIPIVGLDEEITVVADTTAMSMPHEIEYTLVFDSSTMMETGDSSVPVVGITVAVVVAVVAIIVAALLVRRDRKKTQE